MSEETILVEKTDGVAIVTLNRPTVLKALSMELRATLADAIDERHFDRRCLRLQLEEVIGFSLVA